MIFIFCARTHEWSAQMSKETIYVLTWNFAHMANAEIARKLIKINQAYGINTPIICTPEELMEVEQCG